MDSIISRVVDEKGLLGLIGLGVILLSLVPICVAPYIAATRRKLLLLIGCALFLGLSGYVIHDLQHVILNLSMRDDQAVRRTCAELVEANSGIDRTLRGSEIPVSLSRMGARFVMIGDDMVGISLTPEDGLTGMWRGFLYDPKHVHQSTNPTALRATWYRDFYEIRVSGH